RARLGDALEHAFLIQAPSVAATPQALEAIVRIRGIVEREAGSEWAPDFSAQERTLGLIIAQRRGTPLADAQMDNAGLSGQDPAPNGAGAAQGGSLAEAASWRDLNIVSRDVALLAVEKVRRYFETHEPSHPAPVLIRRIQQVVPLHFQELLDNLAPQGVEQFNAWMPRAE